MEETVSIFWSSDYHCITRLVLMDTFPYLYLIIITTTIIIIAFFGLSLHCQACAHGHFLVSLSLSSSSSSSSSSSLDIHLYPEHFKDFASSVTYIFHIHQKKVISASCFKCPARVTAIKGCKP